LGLERVDLIKIDVEGNELGVLQGAIGTLTRFRPMLFMETGHENEEKRVLIHEILSSCGYAILGVAMGANGMADATWDDYLRRTGAFEAGLTDMLLAAEQP